MKRRGIRIILATVFFVTTAYACIPELNFPDTSGCIRQCNEENIGCLNIKSDCPLADLCFNDLEKCFNDANTCNHDCGGCEDKFTCANEDDCRKACGDMANSCTSMITTCVNTTKKCFDTQVDKKESCFNAKDGFVNCVADCVEEIEDEINKL